MCDMLQNNVNLLKIDLSNNGFTDKDTGYLLDALKVMQGWKIEPLFPVFLEQRKANKQNKNTTTTTKPNSKRKILKIFYSISRPS